MLVRQNKPGVSRVLQQVHARIVDLRVKIQLSKERIRALPKGDPQVLGLALEVAALERHLRQSEEERALLLGEYPV